MSAVDDSFLFLVNLVENTLKNLLVYLDVAVDDARPMHDYVCEVGTELLEVDETTLAHIHKPETELVSLVGRAVAHDVHRPGELFESEKSVFVPVEALKNAVC